MLIELLLHYASTHDTLVLLHLQMGTSNQSNVEPGPCLTSKDSIPSTQLLPCSESWRLAHRVHRLCKERAVGAKKLILFVVSRPLVNIAPV